MAHDVSVIIPVYNTPAAYLREAIDSTLGQSVPPAEVIVVDDGSTPDLGWLVSIYGDRLIYVRQPNRGPAAARNTGLKLAKGSLSESRVRRRAGSMGFPRSINDSNTSCRLAGARFGRARLPPSRSWP